MEISFICVNAPQKNNSTLSSEFLLCLFLKNTINSQQSFCQRALFWSDTLCYPFSLFYFCIFEMFLKIYRKLKQNKTKHYRKQLTEEHRAVARKAAPPGSEPQWRLWEERTEHREHGSSSQNTAPQRPGWPPESHMTPSQSCALLGLRVFICENTGLASLGGILGQLNELQQLRELWNHHKNKGFSSLLLLEVLVRDLLYS